MDFAIRVTLAMILLLVAIGCQTLADGSSETFLDDAEAEDVGNVTQTADDLKLPAPQRNPRHRFSMMLLSTSRKSIGCSSPDESIGLKSADFLEIITIPMTNFSCRGRGQGYFADSDIFCRVFHYCQDDQTTLSFICPTCTLFHEEKQLCDFWYNVECPTASS